MIETPKRILLPNPSSEAMLKYSVFKQIQILLAIIKQKAFSSSLILERIEQDKVQEKLKALQNQIRFKNFLAFLEYERLLETGNYVNMQAHLRGVNACTNRFQLIAEYSGLNIIDFITESNLESFIAHPKVRGLSNNSEFQERWRQHEIIDQPKWSSYRQLNN